MKRRVNEGKYKSIHEAADDVRLIWKNCMTYNADGSDFYNLAQVSSYTSCVLYDDVILCIIIQYSFSHMCT